LDIYLQAEDEGKGEGEEGEEEEEEEEEEEDGPAAEEEGIRRPMTRHSLRSTSNGTAGGGVKGSGSKAKGSGNKAKAGEGGKDVRRSHQLRDRSKLVPLTEQRRREELEQAAQQ
jgi:hypothetical protein